MTVLHGLRDLAAPDRRASLESPAVPLTSPVLLDWMGGRPTAAGRRVSERSALAMAAVWRCVSLISGISAALPLHTFRVGTKDKVVSRLLANPHPELTPLELWRLTYAHRVLWGNGYVQKVRNPAGQIAELWPITPSRVQVTRQRPEPGNPSGKWFSVVDDWDTYHTLTPRDILHLPGLGYDGLCGASPIRLAAQGIALGLAAEEYGARLFGSGNLMGGILQTEQRLTPEQAQSLKERWQAKVSGVAHSHEIAVLDAGASFQPVTMPARDSQFLESRIFQIEEIGRWFGVPAFLLGLTSKSTSWGTGLEQQATGFVKFDLQPTWLAPTEQRITKELTPPGTEVRYAVEGLLRGDSASRAAFYNVMRQVGAFSANDIRDLEDRPPIDGGDVYLQPLNMAPLGTADEPASDTEPDSRPVGDQNDDDTEGTDVDEVEDQ